MSLTIPVIGLANAVPGATLLNPDERGVNETFIGFLDAASGRHRAYIKILTGKQLINELVSTTFGRAVGLPIPQGYLVRVLPEELPDSILLRNYGNEIFAFGSRAMDIPDLKRRIKIEGDQVTATLLATWKDWDKAMVFDEWIANIDRHSGNLLIGSQDEVWLIDHSHCFTGPDWNPTDLVPAKCYTNQLADFKIPSLNLPERMALKNKTIQFAEICKLVDTNSALNASFAGNFIEAGESEALQDFLQLRISELAGLISSRLGIPSII